MRYNKLGRTGLLVSELCLGTMTFGGTGEMWSKIGTLQQGEAEALVRTAVDRGINFLDTADVYSGGQSEEITGQALHGLGIARHELVLATKAFGETGPGPNARGSSRVHLIEACKASLKRLKTDYIDLYQLHGFDPRDADRGEPEGARHPRAARATSATSACRTGRRGRSPRRSACPSGTASPGSRACRPITRWRGATSSGNSCP